MGQLGTVPALSLDDRGDEIGRGLVCGHPGKLGLTAETDAMKWPLTFLRSLCRPATNWRPSNDPREFWQRSFQGKCCLTVPRARAPPGVAFSPGRAILTLRRGVLTWLAEAARGSTWLADAAIAPGKSAAAVKCH